MPTPTLLVPGTQATELVDHDDVTVFNAVRVGLKMDRSNLGGRLPSGWEQLLSMEHQPGNWRAVRSSLEDGTTLAPGRVVRVPYERLHTQLDVEDWAYDWRADLRFNALRLLRFLEANRPPHGERWNLVGHSQGGLLIVLASKLAARVDDFARLVGRVALVGTPLAGTMSAFEALLPGRTDFGTRYIDAARGMARTWPSLYQMLPSWRACVRTTDGSPLGHNRQFTQVDGYPPPWDIGIQPDLLARARETQALLQGPFSYFGPWVDVLCIMTRAQDTPVVLGWSGTGGFEIDKPRLDRDAPVPCKVARFRHERGDTLVPCDRTLAWGGDPFAERCVIVEGHPREHALLCDDEDIVALVEAHFERAALPPPAGP